MKITMRLLAAAGTLMLIEGAIFGFLGQWLCAALIWAGAFCCLVAALNLKSGENDR